MAVIRIPDATAFNLRITGQHVIGEYTEDVSFGVLSNLIVNFIRLGREAQIYTIDASGRIVADNDGTLARGKYGVELFGYYNGQPWRYYEKNVFQIVNSSSENDSGTEGEATLTYDITFQVSFGGTGITSAFVDAAIAAHNNDEAAHDDIRDELADRIVDVQVDGVSIVDGNKVAQIDPDAFGQVADVKVGEDSIVDPTTKIATIDPANFGNVDDVTVNGNTVVANKVAAITIPTSVSQLTNDSDYQTGAEVAQAISDAAIDSVMVSVTPDVGTPSATASITGSTINFAFQNMKGATGETGNGIASVEQTTESTVSEGVNVTTITMTDGTTGTINVRNGKQGEQGASAVFDPNTGNILATLENTIGDSDANAMTQKAVSDAVMVQTPINDIAWSKGYRVKWDTGVVSSSSAYSATGYIDISNYDILYVPVLKASTSYGYALFNANKTYITGGAFTGTTEAGGIKYLTVSTNGAKYIRFTGYNTTSASWDGAFPTLYYLTSVAESQSTTDTGQLVEIGGVTFTKGNGINSANGTTESNSNYAYSSYIDISGCDKIYVPTVYPSNSYGYALYDSNKTYIGGGAYKGTETSLSQYSYQVVETRGATYLRFSAYSPDKSLWPGYYPPVYVIRKVEDVAEELFVGDAYTIPFVNGWRSLANKAYHESATYLCTAMPLMADADLVITTDDGYYLLAFRENDTSLTALGSDGNTSSDLIYRRRQIIKKGTAWFAQLCKTGAANITPAELEGKIHVRKLADSPSVDAADNPVGNPYWESLTSFNDAGGTLTKEIIFSTSVDGAGGALRRIPSVIVTNSNTIIAATEVRSVYADNAETGIVIARKVTGGEWQYNNVLPYNAQSYGKVMNPSFCVARTGNYVGRIYLFFLAFPITEGNNGYAYLATTEEMDNMYIYSDDDGATWSVPVSTKSAWDTDEWVWVGVSPANGIDTGGGILAFPTMGRYDGAWYSGVMLFDTSDNGATYSPRSAVASDNESFVFMSNDFIWLDCRVENDAHARSLYVYDSAINTLVKADYHDNPNLVCQQGACQYDGYYLKSANDPDTVGTRHRMTVFASSDGFTWTPALLVNTATTYGYSVIDGYNGVVAIVYENKGTITFVDLSEAITLFANSAEASCQSSEWRLQKLVENLKS